MKRTVLVVEPDPSARFMLERILTAAGYATEAFDSAFDARVLLDEGAFDIAIVDELAGGIAPLDEVRALRRHYPRLPLVVTGTMLSATVVLDLLRIGAADALAKPFTPAELRESIARVAAATTPLHAESLEFAAAITAARRGLAGGDTKHAARALVRAYANAPLDPEVALLEALRAELEGRDEDAARGYRSAIALRDDESASPPDPFESLARLAAYGPARPVTNLSAIFADAPMRLVSEPGKGLAKASPESIASPIVTVFALSIADDAEATVYFRETQNVAFAILTTDLRPTRAAPLLARIGSGRLVSSDAGGESDTDLAALTALRDEILGRESSRSTTLAQTGAE